MAPLCPMTLLGFLEIGSQSSAMPGKMMYIQLFETKAHQSMRRWEANSTLLPRGHLAMTRTGLNTFRATVQDRPTIEGGHHHVLKNGHRKTKWSVANNGEKWGVA